VQIEALADYFAACLLMPKPLIREAWTAGVQDSFELAEIFAVSPAAIEVRLRQLGLSEPRPRCLQRDETLGPTFPLRDRRSYPRQSRTIRPSVGEAALEVAA
jgi:hypothetical protein